MGFGSHRDRRAGNPSGDQADDYDAPVELLARERSRKQCASTADLSNEVFDSGSLNPQHPDPSPTDPGPSFTVDPIPKSARNALALGVQLPMLGGHQTKVSYFVQLLNSPYFNIGIEQLLKSRYLALSPFWGKTRSPSS